MSGISLLSAFSTIACIIHIAINWIKAIMKKEASAYRRAEAYRNSVRVLLPDPVSVKVPPLCNTRHETLRVQCQKLSFIVSHSIRYNI
jgi:hypothetical protein